MQTISSVNKYYFSEGKFIPFWIIKIISDWHLEKFFFKNNTKAELISNKISITFLWTNQDIWHFILSTTNNNSIIILLTFVFSYIDYLVIYERFY